MNVEDNDQSFTFLENPYNIEIVSLVMDVDGILEVTINQSILNSSSPPRLYLGQGVPKYVIVNGAGNIFYVYRKNIDDTLNNNQLQGLFEIHTLIESLPTITNKQKAIEATK